VGVTTASTTINTTASTAGTITDGTTTANHTGRGAAGAEDGEG